MLKDERLDGQIMMHVRRSASPLHSILEITVPTINTSWKVLK